MGLETAQLGGRCETRLEEKIAWHVDGAHTLDSIEAVGKWFISQPDTGEFSSGIASEKPRVLIFNQQTRDAVALSRALHQTLSAGKRRFTHAIFCTNVTFRESGYRPDLVNLNTNKIEVEKLSSQKILAETWQDLSPNTEVQVKPTIEEAVDFVRDLARKETPNYPRDEVVVSVLVTGSLHLVGGFLEVIETTAGSLEVSSKR
jgi:folylpolyglutamate synthase